LAGLLTGSAQSAVPSAGDSVPVQTVVFRGGTASSGWIDFTPHTNFGIYLPVKINGHDAMALLYGGPSIIDTTHVASLGLTPKAAASSVGGINVELGALKLQNATASQDDLQKQGFDARILGHPVLLRLGEEVFNQVAVDIDFPHHRVAFRDPGTLIEPIGSIEIPLVELDGERVLPLAVNGGVPRQFELELGNVIGPLMVTPAFAEKQELLRGHAHSQRLSGRFGYTERFATATESLPLPAKLDFAAGLKSYIAAIDKAFGTEVDYAQIIKTYGNESIDNRRYSPSGVISSQKLNYTGNPNEDLISTSYVERLNATTRLHMRRLTRLTLAFSKKRENFVAAVGLHFAYYNFVTRHNTLRMTPAMAAGVAGSMWSVGTW
jgi:hypothetical protein